MFSTIFSHELRTWFRKPIFYVFAALFFILGGVVMAVATGVFSSDNVTVTSNSFINSPYVISGLVSQLALFCYLMIPTFTGTTIHRDFKNNMHHVLYSYPIKKWEYLLAKFSAGITINLILIFMVVIGLMIGGYLPGHNELLLGPFSFWNYLQPFLLIIIPNVLFYSAIVFAIIVFTRNMNIGFMAVLCLIIIQLVTSSYVDQVDDPFWLSLADPLGNIAISETVEYWTPAEQNERMLPFEGMIFWNRVVWAAISILILGWVIARFRFAQNAVSLFKKRSSGRMMKENYSRLSRVVLPQVSTDFSFKGQLSTLWSLTKADVRYIIFGWPFIIISFLAIALTMVMMFNSGLIFGTPILPKAWVMLSSEASAYILLFTFLLIFLYAGFLMDRSRAAHINQIVDVTPTKSWVFLVSQLLALVIMVAVLQTLLILCGITYQTIQGFADYQLDLYLFQAYMVNVWKYVPWIFMALFIHTLIKNKWLGLATLLIIGIAIPLVTSAIGVDQAIFDFNSIGEPSASDFSGYGASLAPYYTYRLYWILFGIVLLSLALVFYRRGMGLGFMERFAFAKARFSKSIIATIAVCSVLFLSIGGYIWKINNVDNEQLSGKEQEELRVNYEKELSRYNNIPQPKLIAVNTYMDIFPDTRDFKAGATYTMVNQSSVAIDTLHMNVQDYPIEIELDRENEQVYDNEDFQYRMYRFANALQPGDTLVMKFDMHNEPNKFLDNKSPIRSNGTFLNNSMYPSIGYSEQGELRDPKVRAKYNLPPKDRMPDPDAIGATDYNYIGGESDWIDFEATVSTSADQIAIAPGYLIKEWEEDGRKYYHYKMDAKILNFYSFMSGRYDVKKEMHDGVSLEIYHHPDHTYNLDRMMKGLREGLDYYNDNYTPYQHRQARIIEFPKDYGSFAQAFANTIPFSEGVGFIADVDDDKKDAVDYPLAITAHELAHQWWAHQVIGAKAKGATLLSESMSEYSSLKVLEKVYGKNQMRTFLKDAMDQYLSGRTSERISENPLMYNENQPYIHYRKGSVVLYAMSDYIGEDKFNGVAKRFAEKYQFKSAPYPTSEEFVADLKAVTPDSLQYLVRDMFETITLYDNEVGDASYRKLDNGKYAVTVTGTVSKYRSDNLGDKKYASVAGDSLSFTPEGAKKAINSLPLADYIEVGVFGAENEETGENKLLYLEKRKVTNIDNSFEIIVDEEPVEAGIDPYNKLIDRSTTDNRRSVSEKKE
ncbi:ABC-2 type transport system permease protein [Nonlabens sp. Hel1_33_55]|uniref:ABC transporter permease/M1 family aminopeptidase n=1 Tax=Nonlabens sp. Hel1_33_55 TaxID=1336802 RepID=UPI000875E778|nr:M1 family aminopeptidase [Nonlabens sp. Hel1_33_55]SCY21125.1 ABC-2 type transport system permease protein [Nonlabens sp. Hel1_33_55]